MNARFLYVVFVAACVQCFACSTSGEGASPHREAGTSGSGGTSSGTGGTAGAAGSVTDGGGGEGLPDSGETLELPPGCAPDDMRFACNPITNEGCDDSAGEACEYGLDEYFTCFPAPNDVDEGGACDWEQGPWCAAGLTCDSSDPDNPAGTCRRHCCSNTDCKSPETCQVFNAEFGTLGVCR